MTGDSKSSTLLEMTDEILALIKLSGKIIKVTVRKNTTTVSIEWPQTRILGTIWEKSYKRQHCLEEEDGCLVSLESSS